MYVTPQLYEWVDGKERSLAELMVKQGWARQVEQTKSVSDADASTLERADLKNCFSPG